MKKRRQRESPGKKIREIRDNEMFKVIRECVRVESEMGLKQESENSFTLDAIATGSSPRFFYLNSLFRFLLT